MTVKESTKPEAAPWRKLFDEDVVSVEEPVEVVVATIAASVKPSARYCAHAGFWSWKGDDSSVNTDCPFFVTDRRMQKVAEIFGDNQASKDPSTGPYHSGGSGEVTLVYWFKKQAVQWIIKGKAWILAPEDCDGMKKEILPYAYPHDSGQSWKCKIEGIFNSMPPEMRGSFKNPPPGGVRSDWGLKDSETGLEVNGKGGEFDQESLAASNFRIVVVCPDHVEAVYMAPEKRGRVLWRFQPEDSRWSEILAWP